jgi:hypothetical protein
MLRAFKLYTGKDNASHGENDAVLREVGGLKVLDRATHEKRTQGALILTGRRRVGIDTVARGQRRANGYAEPRGSDRA